MPIVLEVKSKQDFDQWLKKQQDALKQPATITPSETSTTTTISQATPGTQPGAG